MDIRNASTTFRPPTGIDSGSDLEQGSARILDGFARFGDAIDTQRSRVVSSFENLISFGASGVQAESSLIQGSNPHSSGSGLRVLSKVAAGTDAFFGIASVASTFSKEHKAGDRRYPQTMRQIGTSVAQISASGLAGAGAAALVAGAGIAGLPFIVGASAALGAGYLAGRAVNWLFGE
ncbi:MAG: hypothetical protein KDD53_09090 [Bdellovibrionales bacterium]|nr:hypothetical protein [Bdellovibrionales bacterium]